MKLPRIIPFLAGAALWALILSPLLASCAEHPVAPEPQIVTQEVGKAVAKSCVPANLPPAPIYRVTVQMIVAAPDMATRYQLVAGALNERIDRLNQVEPVVADCRKPA